MLEDLRMKRWTRPAGAGGSIESPSVAAAVSGACGQAPAEVDARSGGSNARTLVTGIVFGLQARWGATASTGWA